MEFLEFFGFVYGDTFWVLVRVCETDEENLCGEIFEVLLVGFDIHNASGFNDD